MKNSTKSLLMLLFFFSIGLILTGCKDKVTDPVSGSDSEAVQSLIQEDSSDIAFEKNYNEDDAMSFSFGKVETAVYPVKVGRRITSVTRNVATTFNADTALAVVTYTFTGKLVIRASRTAATWGDTTKIDTTILKDFSATHLRKLIFVKIGNNPDKKKNWKLVAHSLPAGGTASSNVFIQKMTLTTTTDTLVITNPTDYYLSRWIPGLRKNVPVFGRGQIVNVKMEVYSAYSDTDFVTITWGGDFTGRFRAKKKFDLVSSTPSGSGYNKVYQQTFRANVLAGFYHTILDVMPKGVVFDDRQAVETKAWGVPYIVK